MATKDKVNKEENNSPNTRFGEVGSTGLNRWDGRIDEDWIREFKGTQKNKTIREMSSNDPMVGAVLFVIDMLIRQVKWRVDAVSEDTADIERKEFAESLMHDMSTSWSSTISEILSFLRFGYSYHEIVYKKRNGESTDSGNSSKFSDGKIGWRKMPIRAQETLDEWKLDESGGVQGFVQVAPPSYIPVIIPIEKSLLFRTTMHKNNPEGRSILRNAFRPWFFKRRIEEIEGIGIERDLAGLPVIYAPGRIMNNNANANDKAVFAELQKIVTNIRRDEQEGVIMPGDRDSSGKRLYELELLSSGGSRQFNTNEIINRYDQRIAMTVLADFILLGHEKVGSFALSDSKTSLFSLAIKAWLDEIKQVFNQYALPRIFKLNGMPLDSMPTLEYGDIETPNLAALGEYISKLSGAGVPLFPDNQLENYLREAGNLPSKPEEE